MIPNTLIGSMGVGLSSSPNATRYPIIEMKKQNDFELTKTKMELWRGTMLNIYKKKRKKKQKILNIFFYHIFSTFIRKIIVDGESNNVTAE